MRELSDGYRTIAALVMDIVRHLHKSFGALEIEQAEDQEGTFWKVLHAGVVLIDEIGVESPYSAETERLRGDVAQFEAKVQTGKATDADRQKCSTG